jgi:hypothetical protein
MFERTMTEALLIEHRHYVDKGSAMTLHHRQLRADRVKKSRRVSDVPSFRLRRSRALVSILAPE